MQIMDVERWPFNRLIELSDIKKGRSRFTRERPFSSIKHITSEGGKIRELSRCIGIGCLKCSRSDINSLNCVIKDTMAT